MNVLPLGWMSEATLPQPRPLPHQQHVRLHQLVQQHLQLHRLPPRLRPHSLHQHLHPRPHQPEVVLQPLQLLPRLRPRHQYSYLHLHPHPRQCVQLPPLPQLHPLHLLASHFLLGRLHLRQHQQLQLLQALFGGSLGPHMHTHPQ